MTKLSITFATVLLSFTLAPTVHAYGTQPAYTVLDVAASGPQTADAGEICISKVSPELATVLALPKPNSGTIVASAACANQ